MALRGGLEPAPRAALESRGRSPGVRLLMAFGSASCWLWGLENSCNLSEPEFLHHGKWAGKDQWEDSTRSPVSYAGSTSYML